MNPPASKVWNRDFLVLWGLPLILSLFHRFITFDPARDTQMLRPVVRPQLRPQPTAAAIGQ